MQQKKGHTMKTQPDMPHYEHPDVCGEDMEPSDFDQWMQQVDQAVDALAGCSVYDLPDFAFRDAYDGGLTPSEAARSVLTEAGW
jgi:hypothetical protein